MPETEKPPAFAGGYLFIKRFVYVCSARNEAAPTFPILSKNSLIDRLCSLSNLAAFRFGDAAERCFFGESPDLKESRTDPLTFAAMLKYAADRREACALGARENDLHRVLNQCENGLGVVCGDIGKGDTGVDNR